VYITCGCETRPSTSAYRFDQFVIWLDGRPAGRYAEGIAMPDPLPIC